MHRSAEPTTEWKIAVKKRLAAQIEHRLMDRYTNKPSYGLRSKLVNTLLEGYLLSHPSALDAAPLTAEEIEALAEDEVLTTSEVKGLLTHE